MMTKLDSVVSFETNMDTVEVVKGDPVGRAITELVTGMVTVGLGEKVLAGVAITGLDVGIELVNMGPGELAKMAPVDRLMTKLDTAVVSFEARMDPVELAKMVEVELGKGSSVGRAISTLDV